MRALVVGGSGLLGRAICRSLATEGYALRIHHHRATETAATLAEEIAAGGGRAELLGADLCDPRMSEPLVAGIDRLDLLVLAIGAYGARSLEEVDPIHLHRMLTLNLAAPLWATRAALPALKAAQGQVIFLLDIGAVQPWPNHAAYSASKAGARQLARSLALELAPDVRVNGVSPGLIEGADGVDARTFDTLEGRIPAGRASTPQEVAEAVLLLARSPRAMTGQVLDVDGGRSLGRKASPPENA